MSKIWERSTYAEGRGAVAVRRPHSSSDHPTGGPPRTSVRVGAVAVRSPAPTTHPRRIGLTPLGRPAGQVMRQDGCSAAADPLRSAAVTSSSPQPAPMVVPAFIVKQRITVMVNRYELLAVDPHGNEGHLLAFAEQKRMKLKEEVVFFADEAKTRRV